MDIETLTAETEAALARIEDEAVKSGLRTRLDSVLSALPNATTEAEKAPLRQQLETIHSEALAAAAQPSGPGGPGGPSTPTAPAERQDWSGLFYILVGGVVLLCFVSVWAYFYAIGPDRYESIEATRPILVFTLIIAMLGFGGALIFRSMFASEPPEVFERRFRLGREIFLVYSGIFGTIIGFYFGAASGEAAAVAEPTAEIAFVDGRVTATMTGGDEPFMGLITAEGEEAGVSMTVEERVLSFAPADAQCPHGATVLVVDGRGRRTQGTVDCDPVADVGNTTEVARNAIDNLANDVTINAK